MSARRRRRWPVHLALLLAPIAAWMLWGAWLDAERHAVDREVVAADGLRWETPGGPLTVRVAARQVRETETWTVTVLDAHDVEHYRREFAVDLDMGGGGFVRALQADSDPPLEVALVDRGLSERSVYLDPGPDGVREVPFARARPAARALAERWFAAYEPSPFVIGGLLIANLWYWVLYWPGLLVVDAIRRAFGRGAHDADG